VVREDSVPAIVARAQQHPERIAVRDAGGAHTYADLLRESEALAPQLLDQAVDLQEARVAYLCHPGFPYVVAQWATWRAGGVGVPLAVSHPAAELAYAIEHTEATIVVVDHDLRDRVAGVATARGLRVIDSGARQPRGDRDLPSVDAERRAIIFFTSGTTGRPKGVVWTHRTVATQAAMLEEAWGWTSSDTILSVLPLHHVHGVINVVTTALWSGAACEVHPGFEPVATWEALAGGDVTVFMAVPTIYVKLIAAWDEATDDVQREWSRGSSWLRLMVSGSAALPLSVLARWEAVTGHRLLERYGMTELGMAISNPLTGDRVAGHVGLPLPTVEVRLVDEDVHDVAPGAPGEIVVRGPGVFLEYWRDPEATRAAFVDGWFRTGDVAVVDEGGYRILGRNSTDIIKTGGFKVSALEIEDAVLAHPAIEECAVVGVADEAWGQRVGAAVVLHSPRSLDLPELRAWLGEQLAPYKIPSLMIELAELPRNAMGKVRKAELEPMFPDPTPTQRHDAR
jgi:malonyl-CoA/methylmalonyl-CoA synthetase